MKGDKNGLIEGMNVSAIISTSEAVMVAVPTTAIVSAQGKEYIFVQTKETPAKTVEHIADKEQPKKELIEPMPTDPKDGLLYFMEMTIRRGISSVGFTQITPIGELPTDAQVVTSGAFFLLAKLTGVKEE